MAKTKPHEMSPICENQDDMQSSGDGVATEGEEEEESVCNSARNKDEGQEGLFYSNSEDASEGDEQLTPYVAKCCGHLETLRKRKREQEEQVETLVEGADVFERETK